MGAVVRAGTRRRVQSPPRGRAARRGRDGALARRVPALLCAVGVLSACGGAPGPADAGADGEETGPACATGQPDHPLESAGVAGDSPAFPTGFLWGTATSAHQVEGGNVASDWWAWEEDEGRVAHGDRSDDGPAHVAHFEDDLARLVADGHTAYRFGIEWAKVFPTREAFDARAPDVSALAQYHAMLTALRAEGITPMVTLLHFSSPRWWIDPTATADEQLEMGFLSPLATADLAAWARFVAGEFGADVDLWITINEPVVNLVAAYVQGSHPPGLPFDASGEVVLRALAGQIFAHAAAYDALHEVDVGDADGDGVAAGVSIAKHQRVFFGADPCSERHAAAAARLDYLLNQVFLDAIVSGDFDANADGDLDDATDLAADPRLVGRADFLGINYYGLTLVNGSFPVGDLLPGLPALADLPVTLPPSDLGWPIYAAGLRTVLDQAAEWGLPIYVTENGVADGADALRPRFLVEHLHVLGRAIAQGVDVRGYFHWSLLDNFEWQDGFCPRFGLYRVDYGDPDRARTRTEGADVYRRIIAEGRVTAALVAETAPYGVATRCD